MYASGTAPLVGRESFTAPPAAGPERGDNAAGGRLRTVAPPDGDGVAGLPADPSAVAALPGSPMEGMLAVFGDFLRSAFEQLGRMLATMVSPSQSNVLAGNPSPDAPGFVAQDADASGLPDGADVSPSSSAGAAYDGSAPYAPDAPDAPAGAQAPDAAGATRVRHGHQHRGAHLHGRRGHGDRNGADSLRPGQRWDLGEGESVTRGRDGSLRITVGGSARDAMPESALKRPERSLEPGLL
jgi:hypothetical protein